MSDGKRPLVFVAWCYDFIEITVASLKRFLRNGSQYAKNDCRQHETILDSPDTLPRSCAPAEFPGFRWRAEVPLYNNIRKWHK
ncbi:hypothetical protein L798_07313 [Zootermopsis nevadensis]|uniref:Uncharacterized protein n=1 Tax=Zootermopsis nevadensis TaxID=136037 RepID=A0A067R8I2_ZOONE|nr:hypothetical protein L798_07313 [Zootermopsis nevadensis]